MFDSVKIKLDNIYSQIMSVKFMLHGTSSRYDNDNRGQ